MHLELLTGFQGASLKQLASSENTTPGHTAHACKCNWARYRPYAGRVANVSANPPCCKHARGVHGGEGRLKQSVYCEGRGAGPGQARPCRSQVSAMTHPRSLKCSCSTCSGEAEVRCAESQGYNSKYLDGSLLLVLCCTHVKPACQARHSITRDCAHVAAKACRDLRAAPKPGTLQPYLQRTHRSWDLVTHQ